jgi:hypothetical protein
MGIRILDTFCIDRSTKTVTPIIPTTTNTNNNTSNGPGSSVGIVTGYGLDGLGIEGSKCQVHLTNTGLSFPAVAQPYQEGAAQWNVVEIPESLL